MVGLHKLTAEVSILLIVCGLGLGTARAEEVQVNTYTTSRQRFPAVAADASGNFVVVWASLGSSGTDSSGFSIQGQRFTSTGTAVGSEFQINSYTTEAQLQPAVAMDADGDFVVVWRSDGSSESNVQGQRYASDGTAVGGEFQINTYSTSRQWFPSVAMDASGDFVIVWDSSGSSGTDSSSSSVQGQRYASDGTAVGGEFQINTYITDGQRQPSVAAAATGDFVVVWGSSGSSGTDEGYSQSVQGQRYASDGSAMGAQFQVNTYVPGQQRHAAVAVGPVGEFVVVWSSYSFGMPLYYERVLGQRYASDGAPVGGEFQVANCTYYARNPSVAIGPGGDFEVVWADGGYFNKSTFDVNRRRYASDGSSEAEFQVNTYTTEYQESPSIAAVAGGDFVIVWESRGSFGTDSDQYSIQRSVLEGIFADGFESGDTSAWSGP